MSRNRVYTPTEHQRFTTLIDHFSAVLRAATDQRASKQEILTTPDGNIEIEFVTYERAQMLNAVNTARTECGLPPVDEATVKRVEDNAAGHSDYAANIALGCANIALNASWAMTPSPPSPIPR